MRPYNYTWDSEHPVTANELVRRFCEHVFRLADYHRIAIEHDDIIYNFCTSSDNSKLEENTALAIIYSSALARAIANNRDVIEYLNYENFEYIYEYFNLPNDYELA